jgi:hypothetical protein
MTKVMKVQDIAIYQLNQIPITTQAKVVIFVQLVINA